MDAWRRAITHQACVRTYAIAREIAFAVGMVGRLCGPWMECGATLSRRLADKRAPECIPIGILRIPAHFLPSLPAQRTQALLVQRAAGVHSEGVDATQQVAESLARLRSDGAALVRAEAERADALQRQVCGAPRRLQTQTPSPSPSSCGMRISLPVPSLFPFAFAIGIPISHARS